MFGYDWNCIHRVCSGQAPTPPNLRNDCWRGNVADLEVRPAGGTPRISNVFITILSGIENGVAHKEVEYSQVGMEVIVIPLAQLPKDVKGRGRELEGWVWG